jgi:hypothetical protein
MTIFRYETHEKFGNEMFAEMDRFLKEEFAETENPLEKKASLKQEPKDTSFSNLVIGLAKAASVLEELEHPAAEKANKILAMVEANFLGLDKKAQPGHPFWDIGESDTSELTREEREEDHDLSRQFGYELEMSSMEAKKNVDKVYELVERGVLDNADELEKYVQTSFENDVAKEMLSLIDEQKGSLDPLTW